MAKASARCRRKRQEFSVRRSDRMANQGRELEKYVSVLLAGLVSEGAIASFKYHEPHSPEDQSGKDFTILAPTGESASFGVTISQRSWDNARVRHARTEQLYFPIGITPERMRQRILELLK